MTVPDFLPVLSRGAHGSAREGACVMEYVSVLAGEPWTDRPACTHPAFANLAIRINDNLKDGERQVLVPLIPRLIGTATTDPHVNVAIAVYLVRELWNTYWTGHLEASLAHDLAEAWVTLDRWARHELVTVDELCLATAAATAAAAAAAAAASAASAAIAIAIAIAAAATATSASAAIAIALAATAAAATAAAASAASAASAYWGSSRDLLRFLMGALDVFDEVTGRTREDLAEAQWRDLACVVAR